MSNLVNNLISCGLVVVNLGILIFVPIIIQSIGELEDKIRELKKQIDYIQQRLDNDEETIRSLTKRDYKEKAESIEALKKEIRDTIGGKK
jgi:predicted PurR-regulated permease PerM